MVTNLRLHGKGPWNDNIHRTEGLLCTSIPGVGLFFRPLPLPLLSRCVVSLSGADENPPSGSRCWDAVRGF